MARQIRIEYDGAAYHVLARGNQGQAIFADDLDRKVWLETLAEACEKTGWRIHAYVMMGHHYHVLVETPEGNLVAGMKWLQGTYTQRYNSRHSVFGHLFQGRYKALVVEGAAGNYFDGQGHFGDGACGFLPGTSQSGARGVGSGANGGARVGGLGFGRPAVGGETQGDGREAGVGVVVAPANHSRAAVGE